MNLALLLPSALLALSALLIPLLIHLSRRSEQKPTDFAALRWISAQLRPRRKLVFQEILLLLLRLLLLIALAFFLAKPVSIQSVSPKHWVVVVPGSNVDAAKYLPTNKNAAWHWLSPGFPEYKKEPDSSNIPFSSLLRELDAQLPANAALTLVVPESLSGLDGERIRLGRNVNWKIVPEIQTTVVPAQAGIQRRESTGSSKATALGPRLRGDDKVIGNNDIAPFRLAIRHDEKHLDSAIYFRAAHTAWQAAKKPDEKDVLDSADVSSPLQQNRSALIWLAAGELPANIRQWAEKGGTILVSKETLVPEIQSGVSAWRNEQGISVIRAAPLGQGRVLQWQQNLKPAAISELLDADFPQHLRSLLQTKPLAPTRSFATSQTPLMGAKAGPEAPQSLQIWLALLIALLFLIERWFANAPRRWSAT